VSAASLLRGLCLAVALVVSGNPGSGFAANPPIDHFVLALSWSPTFCASEQAAAERLQCGSGRRYAFVVHGLWPQYRKGWPEYCRNRRAWVPEDQIAEMLPIMPSKRLIIHEWRKHGTCSNLSMEDYFDFTRTLFEKISIPARFLSPLAPVTTSPAGIISDFVKSNRGLAPEMMVVDCTPEARVARLSELRICFFKDGRFAQCRSRPSDNCAAEMLVLPPIKANTNR
jgi:ribonuclease T2